jgi:hypothetical protein
MAPLDRRLLLADDSGTPCAPWAVGDRRHVATRELRGESATISRGVLVESPPMQMITKLVAVSSAVALLVVSATPLQAQGRGRGNSGRGGGATTASPRVEMSPPTHRDTAATRGPAHATSPTQPPQARASEDGRGVRQQPNGGGPPQRPPGWDKGRKEGWNGGSVPPGLARNGRREIPRATPQRPDSAARARGAPTHRDTNSARARPTPPERPRS